MDATVIVGTFGGVEWTDLAQRAIRSVGDQAPVIHRHGTDLAHARNEGAEMAKSEWLCFLDADDELTPGYFQAMDVASADLRGPMVEYVAEDGKARRKLWPECDIRTGNYLVIGTLVRREMFLEVGGFKDWPLYEDWDLWQRCKLAGASVDLVADAVYRAHTRPGSRNLPPRRERERVWHAIRGANYPELYEAAA